MTRMSRRDRHLSAPNTQQAQDEIQLAQLSRGLSFQLQALKKSTKPPKGVHQPPASEDISDQPTTCLFRFLALVSCLFMWLFILLKITLGANDIVTDLMAGISFLYGGEIS